MWSYIQILKNDEHDRGPGSDVELLMGPNASSESGRGRDHFVAFASSAPTDCLAITAGNSNEPANEDSEAYLLLSVLMNGLFAAICSYVRPCENSCLSLILSYIQYYFPFPFSTLSDYVQLNWVVNMFRLFSTKLGSDYVQLNSVQCSEMSKLCSVIFRFC